MRAPLGAEGQWTDSLPEVLEGGTMKTYRIERTGEGGIVAKVVAEHGEYVLPHIVCHSPTGFETGYGGSGPADLALAILADHFGESEGTVREGYRQGPSRAVQFHQRFKVAFIALHALQAGESYTIKDFQISEWVEKTRVLSAGAG